VPKTEGFLGFCTPARTCMERDLGPVRVGVEAGRPLRQRDCARQPQRFEVRGDVDGLCSSTWTLLSALFRKICHEHCVASLLSMQPLSHAAAYAAGDAQAPGRCMMCLPAHDIKMREHHSSTT
jgi:hypothetical protein